MNNVTKYHRLSDPIFRVSFSLIFIVGGLGHFFRHDWMMERLQASPWLDWVMIIGSPSMLVKLSGVVLIIAGVTLLLGLCTRVSALALFVTLVPITFVIHIAPDHVGPLLKNVAILGGLVHFFVRGAGYFSFDEYKASNNDYVG